MSKFDQEYYVMNVDGANNHPMLDWGNTNFNFVVESAPIDEKTLNLPLKIVFGQPYPNQYEMADLLMLSTNFASSEKLKNLFEEQKTYGIQFIPIEVASNKGEIIKNHYAIHIWNKLPAIDKNNYKGGAPNRFGNILNLQKFSLDENVLNDIPLEKRLIFELAENSTISIVHKTIFEKINTENLTGFTFFRVDDWNDNAFFR